MDNWGYLARPLPMTAAIFRFLFRPCGVLAGTDSRSSQRYHRSRHAVTPALVELESRLAPAIDMAMVTIGNPANTPDPATGHGAVAQEYRIGKYEVTLGQYCAFLNAVADVSDDYRLYNAAMERVASSAGILRAGEAGNYSYTVAGPLGSVVPPGADSPADRPIANVNWFNAARFANWISNGQPDEGTPEQLTENGAYKLQGATRGDSAPRNTINPNTGSAPRFFLPNEDEWYKAAYYDPNLAGGQGGYHAYATRSDTAPGNQIADSGNQAVSNLANYILDATGDYCVTQDPNLDLSQNYLTNVGVFTGSASAYGTFDQNGSVWEMQQAVAAGPNCVVRGGGWTSLASYLVSTYSLGATNDTFSSNVGFRLAGVAEPPAPVEISLVTVGDAGNPSDPATGFGAVGYRFQMASNDVTIGQYAAFLNAVAADDPNQLFNDKMSTDLNIAGIQRQGQPGSYTYTVLDPQGVQSVHATGPDRPITYVSWYDAARFANWMSNGQPRGSQGPTTTENGSYDLVAIVPDQALARNQINPNTGKAPDFFIPLQDEWYKAAYYSPMKAGGPGYYLYASQSDTLPGNDIQSPAIANQVNYINQQMEFSITQETAYKSGQNYLTNVGAFTASPSHYGTFDQNGNVYQWNDLDGVAGPSRGLRGGFWFAGGPSISSTGYSEASPAREASDTGFRLSTGPLPEQREVPPASGPVVAEPFNLAAGSTVASLGNGLVAVWSSDGSMQEFTPFPGYKGPLNVNTLTRSGGVTPDSLVIAVAGTSSPHVLVVDAASGRVAMSLYAFDPKFLGGVSVSGGTTRVGDEWTTVILCGAGSGSEPAVSVFDAVTGASRGAFYAFSPAYKGGVRIALSQPLADGTSYAVVSSTINSHLVVFDLADYATPKHSFYAFPSEIVSAGFTVASADLDLDGTLEIVAGVARQGNSSQVAVMDLSGRLLMQGNVNFPGGVAIAVNDADRNGRLDIVAASGPGIPGRLSTYDYVDWSLIDSLFISDSLNGVAAATNFARA